MIIDEAQNLPFKTLEELRMLSNIDYEGTPLFQVFLVGQPEFRAIMEAPNMEQLRQRVIASYHLEPLSEEETRDYIQHRLAVAGWREDPAFTKGAFKAIYAETNGLPRRINTLSNRLMLYCSLEKAHEVTAKVVETVCAELREEKLEARKPADAMPPVAQVDEGAHADAPAEEDAMAGLKDAVILSLDEARAKSEPAPGEAGAGDEELKNTVEAAPPRGSKTVPLKPLVSKAGSPSSMSVLDRLRAKKLPEDRQEATLTDVANAIAAAAEEIEAAPGDNETPATTDAPAKRKTMLRTIEDAREDLKQANGNIVRLTKSANAGRKRRANIAEGLQRAETLLNELRQAQH